MCIASKKSMKRAGYGKTKYSAYVRKTGKNKGKAKKGYYFRHGGVYEAGTKKKVAGLAGLRAWLGGSVQKRKHAGRNAARRSNSRVAFKTRSGRNVYFGSKRHYPCITRNGPNKGRVKKGWYIRDGRCHRSKK